MSAAERRIAGTTWRPTRSIVLCATPRTGSTLACDVRRRWEELTGGCDRGCVAG